MSTGAPTHPIARGAAACNRGHERAPGVLMLDTTRPIATRLGPKGGLLPNDRSFGPTHRSRSRLAACVLDVLAGEDQHVVDVFVDDTDRRRHVAGLVGREQLQ